MIAAVLVGGCSFQIGASSSRDGDVDDGGPVDDAVDATPIDATPIDAAQLDAPPAVCSTAGLVCPSGTSPHLIPCGPSGACWVGCRDGTSVDHDGARALCSAWGGKLGWIDSPLEESCLRMTIDGAIHLGLVQAPSSALLLAGWTWNGDTVIPLYVNWSPGQPNDGDGVENGTEQCAYSSSSSTWQDEPCTAVHSRFTCRR